MSSQPQPLFCCVVLSDLIVDGTSSDVGGRQYLLNALKTDLRKLVELGDVPSPNVVYVPDGITGGNSDDHRRQAQWLQSWIAGVLSDIDLTEADLAHSVHFDDAPPWLNEWFSEALLSELAARRRATSFSYAVAALYPAAAANGMVSRVWPREGVPGDLRFVPLTSRTINNQCFAEYPIDPERCGGDARADRRADASADAAQPQHPPGSAADVRADVPAPIEGRDAEADSADSACAVCALNEACCALVPCGHAATCIACTNAVLAAAQPPLCPMCRAKVCMALKIFKN
jgi:hypothetical protein